MFSTGLTITRTGNGWEPKTLSKAAFFNIMTPKRQHNCDFEPKLRGWVFPTPLRRLRRTGA